MPTTGKLFEILIRFSSPYYHILSPIYLLQIPNSFRNYWNAWMPVMSAPMIRVWMSCVPS